MKGLASLVVVALALFGCSGDSSLDEKQEFAELCAALANFVSGEESTYLRESRFAREFNREYAMATFERPRQINVEALRQLVIATREELGPGSDAPSASDCGA